MPAHDSGDRQLVPGITLSATGQANIDPSVSKVLFDLALKLEEPTDLPVDIEHVLAALVMADRQGELDPQAPLSAHDPVLTQILAKHVKIVFDQFGGQVGDDD